MVHLSDEVEELKGEMQGGDEEEKDVIATLKEEIATLQEEAHDEEEERGEIANFKRRLESATNLLRAKEREPV